MAGTRPIRPLEPFHRRRQDEREQDSQADGHQDGLRPIEDADDQDEPAKVIQVDSDLNASATTDRLSSKAYARVPPRPGLLSGPDLY